MGLNLKEGKIKVFNIEFGYLELFLLFGFIVFHMAHIRALRFHYEDMEVLGDFYRLDNIVKGIMPVTEHSISYGPLLWYFHAMFYNFMPHNIFSTNIILLVISPVVSFLMGYIISRLVFKESFPRICFLLMSMLLATYSESWYFSCRVWIGLLAIALFSSGILENRKNYMFISGLILVSTFFISHEISVYAACAMLMTIVTLFFFDKEILRCMPYFVYGLFLSIGLFGLLFQNLIKEYLISIVIQSQHYNWAMGWSFPDIFDERHKIWFGYFRPTSIHLLGLSVIFITWFKKRKPDKYRITKLLPFILFGILSFRTLLSRADDGHLHFILPSSIVVLGILIEILNRKRNYRDFITKRYFLSILIATSLSIFFFRNIISDQFQIYKQRLRFSPREEELFYAPLGIFLKNDRIREFSEVSDYIEKNTGRDDFIYIFPRGPYYYLANRRNATTHYDFSLVYTRQMRQELINDIEEKRVKFIINPIIWFPDMNNLLFTREMEDYVNTNFTLDRKIYNTLIFKRLPYPIDSPRQIVTKGFDYDKNLRITDRDFTLEFDCDAVPSDTVEIEIGLLRYPFLLRNLAKPSLELISYDDKGMVSYKSVNIPSDGEVYPIRYRFNQIRNIKKLEFILSAPGLFNPQPSLVYIDKISLFKTGKIDGKE